LDNPIPLPIATNEVSTVHLEEQISPSSARTSSWVERADASVHGTIFRAHSIGRARCRQTTAVWSMFAVCLRQIPLADFAHSLVCQPGANRWFDGMALFVSHIHSG